ncbi:DUF3000 domain-containing protein [Schaalia sp. 19OD2882]|uniref:DUF3000 domain-containing protein n=1 Tax=Schaalia sp. 19OD2882 TaxID=2794089 RepID=UPI001C1F05B0|nr:DUF3000 domain-containing protein [Schaalia sp. 19OD2882]QWW20444.1 DUF3000 domain-containing protein [Schaalia sp. 19OD2882]
MDAQHIYCGRVTVPEPPEDFITALYSLREAATNPLVQYEEVPSPTRLAPWTAALALRTIAEDHSQPRSSGRFVVLYDPEGQPGWNGEFRLVAQLRSQIEPEMGEDPILPRGVWNWAHDCLEEAGAGFHDLTGTVTRELSESFGGLELRGATMHVELRASWTPNTPWIGEHLNAWADLMCRSSGALATTFLEGIG